MYIANKTNTFPCTGYFPTRDTVRFSGIVGLTLPISGEIRLVSEDNNLILAIQDCGDYARQSLVDGVLTLTNEPEAAAPTIEELRAEALARIDGKCEAAIVADLTVDGVVYPMTRGTAQDDLARAVARANAGDAAIAYGPHGQFASLYTPQQVLEIDTEFYDRCILNRTYYGLLQAWIRTENDAAVLAAIDYGWALPDAYAELLTAQMTAVGIDASAFVAALTTV